MVIFKSFDELFPTDTATVTATYIRIIDKDGRRIIPCITLKLATTSHGDFHWAMCNHQYVNDGIRLIPQHVPVSDQEHMMCFGTTKSLSKRQQALSSFKPWMVKVIAAGVVVVVGLSAVNAVSANGCSQHQIGHQPNIWCWARQGIMRAFAEQTQTPPPPPPPPGPPPPPPDNAAAGSTTTAAGTDAAWVPPWDPCHDTSTAAGTDAAWVPPWDPCHDTYTAAESTAITGTAAESTTTAESTAITGTAAESTTTAAGTDSTTPAGTATAGVVETFEATEIKERVVSFNEKTTYILEIFREGADMEPKIDDIYHWDDNGMKLDLNVARVDPGEDDKFDIKYEAGTQDEAEYKRWQQWHNDNKEKLTVSLRYKEK